MNIQEIWENAEITISKTNFQCVVTIHNYPAPPEWAESFLQPLLEERIYEPWGDGGYIQNSLVVFEKEGILQFNLSHGDKNTLQWAIHQVRRSEDI